MILKLMCDSEKAVFGALLMVLYTEISNQTFLYIFSSRFWQKKSFQTLSECESRIVGRSPNFANVGVKSGQMHASRYSRWKVVQVLAILVATLRHQLGSFVK